MVGESSVSSGCWGEDSSHELMGEAHSHAASPIYFFPPNPANFSSWKFQIIKDRKSTRLNSSHANISYAVFCLKKKKDNSNVTYITELITTLNMTSTLLHAI